MTWSKKSRPTNKELTILGILWNRGPSTVRQVHEALDQSSGIGYTTTLKVMQLMLEKGLLKRDPSQRSHVYEAAVPAEQGQTQALNDLIDRVFSGSAERLLVRALSGHTMSNSELASIKRLIDKMERK